MRLYASRLLFALVAALLIPISASAQYVGVTSTTFDGGQGVFTYNIGCHAAHRGSRMCTSTEVMNTVNPPIVGSSGETAWVRPVHQPGGSVDLYLLDASGETALSCDGWSVTGTYGLTIDLSDGVFYLNSCPSARKVTCCIPVPEPSAALSIPSGAAMVLALAKLRGVGLG
jgi:hypothetical protein